MVEITEVRAVIEGLCAAKAVIAGDPAATEQITRDHFMSVIAAFRQLEEVKAQYPGITL